MGEPTLKSRVLVSLPFALGALLTLGVSPVAGQQASLIPFELIDQFDRVHRQAEFAERIVVLIGGDKGGSDYTEIWGDALHAALENDPGFERVAFLPVADLKGVPFFLKGFVRGQFPEETEKWALMDWDGLFGESYDFVPGWTNILLFGPEGRLAHRTWGQDIDDEVLEGILATARVLIARSG
jgi:hypothetical protein